MSQITNNVPIVAPVTPTDTADQYPSHIDTYGKGGYRSVSGVGDDTKNNIPVERRSWGMKVYDISEAKFYILTPPVPGNLSDPANDLSSNTQWVEQTLGSIPHNSTTSIQGGTTNEYYHLNASEYGLVPLLTSASITPTANTLVLRSSAGRSQVNDPVADLDIVNKQYLTSVINGINIDGNHNELEGLQGGDPSSTIPEFYHLTFEEYNRLSLLEDLNTDVVRNSSNVDSGSTTNTLSDILEYLDDRIDGSEVDLYFNYPLFKNNGIVSFIWDYNYNDLINKPILDTDNINNVSEVDSGTTTNTLSDVIEYLDLKTASLIILTDEYVHNGIDINKNTNILINDIWTSEPTIPENYNTDNGWEFFLNGVRLRKGLLTSGYEFERVDNSNIKLSFGIQDGDVLEYKHITIS